MRSNLMARECSSTPALTPCQTGVLGLIGKSTGIRKTIEQIQRIAGTNVSVLIHGESGTGKELVAKAIHFKSTRADQPFVALNAASIPEGVRTLWSRKRCLHRSGRRIILITLNVAQAALS